MPSRGEMGSGLVSKPEAEAAGVSPAAASNPEFHAVREQSCTNRPGGLSQYYRFRYSCDMARETTYRETVREIALDHYGYVSTRHAVDAGVPAVELPKLAARGGLQNVAYGLYRVPDVPPTRYDQFAEALLRAGEGAYLHGESVLALFGLADVNPRQIKVAVRRRTRPRLPSFIELSLVRDDVRITFYEGLESQSVVDALIECRGRIEADRLLDAAEQARAEGLLTTTEWQRLTSRAQT